MADEDVKKNDHGSPDLTESGVFLEKTREQELAKRAANLFVLNGGAGFPVVGKAIKNLGEALEPAPQTGDTPKIVSDRQTAIRKTVDAFIAEAQKLREGWVELHQRKGRERGTMEKPATAEKLAAAQLHEVLAKMIDTLEPAHGKEARRSDEPYEHNAFTRAGLKGYEKRSEQLFSAVEKDCTPLQWISTRLKRYQGDLRKAYHAAENAADRQAFDDAIAEMRGLEAFDGKLPQLALARAQADLAENAARYDYTHVLIQEKLLGPRPMGPHVKPQEIETELAKRVAERLKTRFSEDEQKRIPIESIVEGALKSMAPLGEIAIDDNQLDIALGYVEDRLRGRSRADNALDYKGKPSVEEMPPPDTIRARRASLRLALEIAERGNFTCDFEKSREIATNFAKEHRLGLQEHPSTVVRNSGNTVAMLATGAAVAGLIASQAKRTVNDTITNQPELDENGRVKKESTVFSRVAKVTCCVLATVAAAVLVDKLATGGRNTAKAVDWASRAVSSRIGNSAERSA